VPAFSARLKNPINVLASLYYKMAAGRCWRA
jgi:hypothetical protein